MGCKKDKFYKNIEGEWQLKSAEVSQENIRRYEYTYNGATYNRTAPFTYNSAFDGNKITGFLEEGIFYTSNISNSEADYSAYENIENEMNETWVFSDDGLKLTIENNQERRVNHTATNYIFYRKKEDGTFFSLPTSYYTLTTLKYNFEYDVIYSSKKDLQSEYSKLTLRPISATRIKTLEYFILNPDGSGFTGDYYYRTGNSNYTPLADYNAKSKTSKSIASASMNYTIDEESRNELSLSAADSTVITIDGETRTLNYKATLKLEKK